MVIINGIEKTNHTVQQLKQQAIQESGNSSISSYQAVLASVWKTVVAAQKLPPEQKVCLYLKADLRKRLSPALPPTYFGNALEAVSVKTTAADVTGESKGEVAARIRKAVDVLNDEEYIRGRMAKCKGEEFMQLMGELKSGKAHVLYVIHGPRLPIFDVDMGMHMGRPLAVRPATILSDPIMFVYPGQEKGSIDACVRFTSSQTLHNFLSMASPFVAI
ncbi:hypothetical protein L7F22_033001 [Adiantum nelumboides]|nr:hypothetical protein [Adiantum nelumboides]